MFIDLNKRYGDKVVSKKRWKTVVFLFVFFIGELIVNNKVYGGEILSKFVFDWDSIFFVQPKLKNISMYNNQFMLEWNKVDGVDGYIVYRKSGKTWKEIKAISGSKNNWYFDKDIDSKKSYSYTVSAYKKRDNIKLVSKRDQIGLKHMDGPVITKIEKYYIQWEHCKNIDGYEISYRDNIEEDWEKICTVNKKENIYNIGGMYKKDRYFRVRGYYKTEDKKFYSKGENYITFKDKKYDNLKILFEGDDILKNITNGELNYNYAKRVRQLTDAQVVVNAKKGRKVKDIIKNIEKNNKYFKGYDIICIALGTNDYLDNVKIGNVTDNNKKSFYGQLNYIVKQIDKQNSSAKVVFITPSYRNKYKKKENVNCYSLKNDKNYTLDDYCNAMRQIGSFKGIYVYDSEKAGIINVDNVRFTTTDLIHPTALAHGKIGCSFTSFLVEYDLLK